MIGGLFLFRTGGDIMKQNFQSAADRRWQQRFERIMERKTCEFDSNESRKERRKARGKYKIGEGNIGVNISFLDYELIAVTCTSYNQLVSVYNTVKREMPHLIPGWDENSCKVLWTWYQPVTLGLYDGWLFVDRESFFSRVGYKIITFDEIRTIKDLGKIKTNDAELNGLLGLV